MRDHGGNIDEAIATFGGDAERWIDLSTGVNRIPYPLPPVPAHAWTDLPTAAMHDALRSAAASAYGTTAAVLPVAGAQAAIQMIPRLCAPGKARVLSPTYNEHAAALRLVGWDVTQVEHFGDLAGADLAVIVNPNNPDGSRYEASDVLTLSDQVRYLIVDESFADASPDLSLATHAGQSGLLVLRSFGKFYGLAGIRLGFVLGHGDDLAALQAMSGPWSVSGVALAVGQAALADDIWRQETISKLRRDTRRLDQLARNAGWKLVGGTELFRTYVTPDATQMQENLARHHIWSRIFPYSMTWVRLGVPGNEEEWLRLQASLRATIVS
jgi:cobalamin biosynthetic protein CobC